MPVRLLPELRERFLARSLLPRDGSSQSDVFHVSRRSDNQPFILKQYNRRPKAEEHRVDRSLMEELRRATSPHLVHVEDYGDIVVPGTNERVEWELLELVQGGSLTTWLSQQGALESKPELFQRLLSELCACVQGFQALGSGTAVHRDIKPQNFFVSGTEPLTILLGDFGLSRSAANSIDVAAQRVGTERYLPPEADLDQFHFSAASDWWAVGVIAGEALLGGSPWQDLTTPAMRRRIFAGDLGFIDTLDDERQRHLLRGLLHPSARPERWTGAQVQRWLAGGSPVVAAISVTGPTAFHARSLPPFSFEGQPYRNEAELLLAMGTLWREAIPMYLTDGSRHHQQLVAWFRDVAEDSVAARIAESANRAPENRLAGLAALLTPDQPRFRDIDLRLSGLFAYLNIEAESSAPSTQDLDLMYQLGILNEFGGAEGQFANLAHEWQLEVDWLRAQDLDPVTHHIWVLSALLDSCYREDLLARAHAAASNARALADERFADLVDLETDGAGVIGRCCAILMEEADAVERATLAGAQDRKATNLTARVARRVRRLDLEQPAIRTLSVEPSPAVAGTVIRFEWSVFGAASIVVDGVPGLDQVENSGSHRFLAHSSSRIRVYATSPSGGTRYGECQLEVVRKPVIRYVELDRPAVVNGDTVTVRWHADHASHVRIAGFGTLPPVGERPFIARQSGSVLLEAISMAGTTHSRSGTLTVFETPPITPSLLPLPMPDIDVAIPVVIGPQLARLPRPTFFDADLPSHRRRPLIPQRLSLARRAEQQSSGPAVNPPFSFISESPTHRD
jgi:serine/threonine protein kinase